jgi:ABC-type antimicrobial peptide transport system permease subunit
VIGIVEDARRGSVLEEPNLQYYVPLTHPTFDPSPEMLFARVSRTGAATMNAVRDALLEMEPRLRFVNVRPLSELTSQELRSWTLGASMFTVFGLLALVVAAIGLYSVLAFDVAQRTREIGLRSALGAGTTRQVASIMGRAARMTLAGLAAGVVAALLLAPRIEGLLYHTSPRDPVTIAFVSVVLLAVAGLASGIPAWRAASVDPNVALRSE